MVTLADGYGRQHLSSCAADLVVCVFHNLWPALPYKPQMCFDFKFLDHLESMMLENQISLKGFCDGIQETIPKLIKKNGKDLYSGLKGATLAEYRFFREQLRTLKPLCSVLSAGNDCPACPKNKGSIFLSMDACFGLFRKKSASKHILSSRHSDLFFLDQENVDDFVESYQFTKSVNKDRSKFNAGSATSEILNRNKLFDIKAVFGSFCRHEFPNTFMNLKHGERIAYHVLLIKEKLEECAEKPRLQLHFTYDIACMSKKHLMVRSFFKWVLNFGKVE
eukprot:gene13416-14792_t